MWENRKMYLNRTYIKIQNYVNWIFCFCFFFHYALLEHSLFMFWRPLLSVLQRDWVNEYHRKCREVVGAELERQGRKDALEWLIRETQLIAWGPTLVQSDPFFPEVLNDRLLCSVNRLYFSHLSLCLTLCFFCKSHRTCSFIKDH